MSNKPVTKVNQTVRSLKQHQELWFTAWTGVLQRIARALSGRKTKLEMVLVNEPSPAWTDGETIFLNSRKLKDALSGSDPVKGIVAVKGLVYHEVAHVLYTPRTSSELNGMLTRHSLSARLYPVYMMLEDHRIETRFVKQYGPARRYFEATSLTWILSQNVSIQEIGPLILGRKFLPKSVRLPIAIAMRQQMGDEGFAKMMNLIDEYLGVDPNSNPIKAFGIIVEMHDVLSQHRAYPDRHPETCKAANSTRKGQPQRLNKAVSEAIQEDAEEDTEDLMESVQQSIDSTADEATDDDDEDMLTASAAQQQIKAALKEAAAEAEWELGGILEDEEVITDSDNMLSAVRAELSSGATDYSGSPAAMIDSHIAPSEEVRRAKVNMERKLRKIRVEASAEIVRHRPYGRIDMQSILNARPGQMDVFRDYDEGAEDEQSVEMVVLVDASGSMESVAIQLSETLWALKNALDAVEVRTTVLTFGNGWQLLYKPEDKTGSRIGVLNTPYGTVPLPALEKARTVLLQSHQSNLVLVTLTDGAWSNASACDDVVALMNRAGVHTLLIELLSANVRGGGDHNHQIYRRIQRIGEMAPIIETLVERIMRNAVLRRA